MNNQMPLIHIGFPKTATKWMQKHLFPLAEDCFFLARPDVFDLLIKPDVFSFSPTYCKNEIYNRAKGRRVLISEELFVGGLDIGYGLGEFCLVMGERLRNVFNDAIVVISIRNQVEIASSAYSHYIKSGGTFSPEHFFGVNKRFKPFFKNHHFFNPQMFEYHKLIIYYQKLFGEENVRVIFYEDFALSQLDFVKNFLRTNNISINKPISLYKFENKRISFFSLWLMRIMNRFTHQNTYFKDSLIHIPTLYYRTISVTEIIDRIKIFNNKPFTLSHKIRQYLTDFYRDSNRELSQITGEQKLIKYNYPL